ncbi:hypothetical protein ZWY2020_027365 [Hordeum vulgare]|nr:hypothetical protein ZWY2020_027365 [Hordeum vulgare]
MTWHSTPLLPLPALPLQPSSSSSPAAAAPTLQNPSPTRSTAAAPSSLGLSPSSAQALPSKPAKPSPHIPPNPNSQPMVATMREHDGGAEVVVTPGELLGPSSILEAGRGAYAKGRSVRASVTGRRRFVFSTPGSSDEVGFT